MIMYAVVDKPRNHFMGTHDISEQMPGVSAQRCDGIIYHTRAGHVLREIMASFVTLEQWNEASQLRPSTEILKASQSVHCNDLSYTKPYHSRHGALKGPPRAYYRYYC